MQSLVYYRDLLGTGNMDAPIELNIDEQAVILKAHDYGIRALEKEV